MFVPLLISSLTGVVSMMPSFEERIKKLSVAQIEKDFQITVNPLDIKVDTPPSEEMGDVALPLGFLLAKTLRKKPFDIVSDLSVSFAKLPEFSKAEPAMPGFLNLTLSLDFIHEITKDILFNPGAFDFAPQDKTIFLEYVSANPTGPLHIGHGRWAALGDSLARLLKQIGYPVIQEFYVNDAGNQIENLTRTVEALKAGKPVPENGYHGVYIQDALKSDLEPKEYFLEQQKNTLKDFRVVFDSYFSEKSLHDSGVIPDAIALLKTHGHIYELEGALWFKSTEFGDDKDRVLIKTDGNYTYFAPDIAYHLTKIQRGGDWLIDILGADHHGYVKRLTAAVLALSDKKAKLDILIGQLVSLYRGGEPVRMSKRTGDMITLQEVIDEIGADALRYILVSKRHTQTIDFDMEEVKKQNKDNPVFYIQYAFARINSILKKIESMPDLNAVPFTSLEPSERKLLLAAARFKDEIYYAATGLEPHRLANYLLDMAGYFHSFYEKNRVIDKDELIAYRLLIIQTAAKVLEGGLSLLGIHSPQKM